MDTVKRIKFSYWGIAHLCLWLFIEQSAIAQQISKNSNSQSVRQPQGLILKTPKDFSATYSQGESIGYCYTFSKTDNAEKQSVKRLKSIAIDWSSILLRNGFKIFPISSGADFIEIETDEAQVELGEGYLYIRLVALLHVATEPYDAIGQLLAEHDTIVRKDKSISDLPFLTNTYCARVYPIHTSFSTKRNATFRERQLIEASPGALDRASDFVKKILKELDQKVGQNSGN